VETLLAEFSNSEEATASLVPAVWSFTLTGYKDNAVILTGSIAAQTISLTGTNILNFVVAPVSEGQGTINLVIELPDGSGITRAQVFKDGTELTSVSPVDGKIIVAGTYAAGTYRFVIRLYKDSDLYGVISEAVYVQANLQSEKTYTLSAEDLNLIYVITYHLGDGQTETGYFKWTEAITLPTPSRAGHVFEGWYENEALSGQPVTTIPVGSAGDKRFYAKWTVIQYTVTFNADGGSPATQTQPTGGSSSAMTLMYSSVHGGTWTLLNDGRRKSPVIDNNIETKSRISFTSTAANASISIQLDVSSDSNSYAFISTLDNAAAWYLGGYYEGSRISGEQSVTVTIPVLTAGSHFIDIGYQKNNLSSGSDCAWFKVIDAPIYVGAANMPSEPTKSGYTFGGWYTQQNGDGYQFYATTVVTEDITLYAKWIPQYTVTFNADGGSPATQTKIVNSSSSIGEENMSNTPTKSGYSFGGWYTQQNGGGHQFYATTAVTENITLYAKWIPQYTVTFNADGGSPPTQTKIVNSGASVGSTNMPSQPTKSEYDFNGWYTETNGNGTQFTADTTVTGNITLYAKWTLVQYTVTFDADGGSPSTQTRSVSSGYSVGSTDMPSSPLRNGYDFVGWYTAKNGGGSQFAADTTVTGNRTVYAQWTIAPLPDNLSLYEALTWLDTNALDGNTYTITVTRDETIASRTLSYSGKTVSITLKGDSQERTVSLGSSGALFIIGSGVTLTLDNNITLQGFNSGNSASLVRVNGGALEMKDGSKISSNLNSSYSSYGSGGVEVSSGAFTMSGGTISGNTVSYSSYGGGGVLVYSGTFTMSGGTISGNTASYSYGGGGVFVYSSGTFTMSGGTISGNTAASASYGSGGVFVYNGTFIKQSTGIIYGSNALDTALNNTASSDSYGHAVYVSSGSKKRNNTAGVGVTMNSGTSGSSGGWE
jgi:uncharacterized repeat protein (TIGR02543 family)